MKNAFHHSKTIASAIHKHVMKHKKYHHYFLLSLVALSAGFFLYNNKTQIIHAATFNFTQADFTGGVVADSGACTTANGSWTGTECIATDANNKTGWKYFSATSTSIVATSSGDGASLGLGSYSFTDDGATTSTSVIVSGGGFANSATSSTVVSGSGSGASIQLAKSYNVAAATHGSLDIGAGTYWLEDDGEGGSIEHFTTASNGCNRPGMSVTSFWNGGGYCSFDTNVTNSYIFTTINIPSGWALVAQGGYQPGAILNATGAITVVGRIDADAAGAVPGAGGGLGGATPTGPVAGMVGSINGSGQGGGSGGSGGKTDITAVGGRSYPTVGYPTGIDNYGGAGGGFYQSGSTYLGGAGGGSISLKSPISINISGTISANGYSVGTVSYPGGGGGRIKLVSPSITHTGTMSARGGNANPSGQGGGGGGGIILKMYETYTGAGTSNVAGGTGGVAGGVGINTTFNVYNTSGTSTSAVINLGASSSFTSLTFSSTTPTGVQTSCNATSGAGCAIKIQIATSSSQNGPWSYYGPDGTTNTYFTSNNSNITTSAFNGAQYVKYQAVLSTLSPATSTPTLNDVTINYNHYALSGDITSSKYDSGSDANLVNNILWASSTPAGTNVKFQLRSASTTALLTDAVWCGPTTCSTSSTTPASTYFETSTGIVGGIVTASSTHILNHGSDDRYFQYKAFLTSNGTVTPVLTNVTVQYVVNAPPTFDTSSGTGVTASQIVDSSSSNWGKTVINYTIRDGDGDTGNSTPNYVTPTFEYSLNGGSTWTVITPSTLTYSAPQGGELSCYYNNATSTLGSSYTASSNTCAGNVLNLIATTTDGYKMYTVRWDASAQVEASSANTKIRVTINDNEAANNTATAISSAFNFDSAKPVTTLTFDAGVAGETNGATISIRPTDATSSLEYFIYDNYEGTTNTSAASTGWVSVVGNATTTIPWTFDADIDVKTLKYLVRDAYGNTTATATVSTIEPVPEESFIVQDTSNILSDPIAYSLYIGWQVSTSTIFADYEVEYATSTELNGVYSPYVEVAEVASVETEYYVHTNLNTNLFYRYRLGIRDDNGNITVRSNPITPSPYITAVADGVQNYGEGGGGTDVSNPLAISNASSTSITANEATITWTTNKYSTSSVEFSSPGDSVPTLIIASTTISNAFALNHSVKLNGLQANKYYSYQVKSTDTAGNTVTSSNSGTGYNFQTKGGPAITNVHTTQAGITDTTATIYWTTDVLSDSKVYYSTNSSAVNTATYVFNASSTTAHEIELVGLKPGESYYFKVESVSAADSTLISTDSNNGSFYTFNTGSDTSAPVVSSIATPVIASDSAVITWTTNEKATSQVIFGTSSSTLDHYTAVDTYPTLNHNVSLKAITNVTEYVALLPKTVYYFRVVSRDFSSLQNSTSSAIQSFTTTEDGVVVITMTSGGGSSSSKVVDTVPPVIISSEIDKASIGAFNVDVKVTASEPVNMFVSYGETTNYGSVEADMTPSTSKTIKLRKLKTGTNYHYRVEVMDAAGNRVPSADSTFTTKFISEVLDNRATIDKADELQGQIEELLESALPSLSPPYVSKPEVSNITESSASISWNTNIKAIGALSYSEDSEYVVKNEYTLDVSSDITKKSKHVIELENLKPNTKYHIQAKSYVFPQVMGKSPDIVFITKAARVKADILERRKDGFTVAWSTDEPTSSIVEYTNVKTGDSARIADESKKTYHIVKVENLPSATAYKVKVSGLNANGNTIEAVEEIEVTTSSDSTEPIISNFKVDNALVPGRTDRIQTVVGWQTDEPANAVVYYEEGAGTPGDTKELASKVESLDVYTNNHIMILASLKPGAIYRIKVISTDSSGNSKVFGPRTIITPRQTESVLDIIFKNFEDTFKFLRK